MRTPRTGQRRGTPQRRDERRGNALAEVMIGEGEVQLPFRVGNEESGSRRREGRKGNGCAGFTMVEIAIAIAVIGFALVAIIGVLPTGLQVQRDNREETIINQDGTYWLQAIRNGAAGSDGTDAISWWRSRTVRGRCIAICR